MNWKLITATFAAALLAAGAVAQAKDRNGGAAKEDAQPAASVGQTAPEKISGQVVKIDRSSGMVTVRGDDGQIHEFRGSKETLQDLKVGEKIDLSKRAEAPRR